MSMHNCYDIVTHSRFKSFRTLDRNGGGGAR